MVQFCKRVSVMAALTAGLNAPALADDTDLTAELNLVVASLNSEGLASGSDSYFDLGARIDQAHLFDNGLEIGVSILGRVQKDAASRPGFIAGFGLEDPMSVPVRSVATGVSAAAAPVEDEMRASLEQAFAYLRFGWGEFSIGKDSGVASRLDARAPTLLNTASTFSPAIDPSGVNLVRARNDVTGQSAKFSYETPRLVGLKLGLSFTPQADDANGLDFAPGAFTDGIETASLENVVEGSLSFSRRFRQSGVRVRAAITGIAADTTNPLTEFRDYSAIGAGLELDWNDWQAGFRILESNNAHEHGNYEAVELGVIREVGKWRLGANWGRAEDQLQGLESQSSSIGVSYEFARGADLGVVWRQTDSDSFFRSRPSMIGETDGVIVELSVRNG